MVNDRPIYILYLINVIGNLYTSSKSNETDEGRKTYDVFVDMILNQRSLTNQNVFRLTFYLYYFCSFVETIEELKTYKI